MLILACSSLSRERESSTQSTLQTNSSQSNVETDSDSYYEDVNFGKYKVNLFVGVGIEQKRLSLSIKEMSLLVISHAHRFNVEFDIIFLACITKKGVASRKQVSLCEWMYSDCLSYYSSFKTRCFCSFL